MKPENLVLLGFVKKALAYLENNDVEGYDSNASKNREDLQKLKKELDDEFASSMLSIGGKVNQLVNSGEAAFDDFIRNEDNQKILTSDLARVLDSDFGEVSDRSEALEAALETPLEEIEKVVSAEETASEEVKEEKESTSEEKTVAEETKEEKENSFSEEVKAVKEEKEEEKIKETVMPKEDEKTELDKPLDNGRRIIGLYCVKTPVEEEKPKPEKIVPKRSDRYKEQAHPVTRRTFGKEVKKEESYLGLYKPANTQNTDKTITETDNNNQTYLGLFNPHKGETKEDPVTEVKEAKEEKEVKDERPLGLYNPDKTNAPAENKPEETKEEKASKEMELSEEEQDLLDEQETVFEMSEEDDELFQQIAENVNKSNEEKQPPYSAKDDPYLQGILDSIFNEVMVNEEDKKLMSDEPAPVDRNDILDLIKEIQKSDEAYYSHIKSEPFIPQYGYDTDDDSTQTKAANAQDIYVSDLISELRDKMVEEDIRKNEEEQEFQRVFEKIHQNYPYLSSSFIKAVYNMKGQIGHEYPLDIEIIILHRLIFQNVENLRQFVEIALNHGYSINADENKLIVDVFKQYVNSDGKIISTIYEVANQAALLNGEYDGYKVLKVKSLF